MFELYVGWVERLFAKPSIRLNLMMGGIHNTLKKHDSEHYTAKLYA